MESETPGPPIWRELRWISPLLLAVLIVPPLLTVFHQPLTLFGLPLLLIYIFGVWVLAIAVCALVARRTQAGRTD
ncbi:MAG: hypothetical protein AAFY02_12410 [Pseudomonadota bacterium]